MTRQITVIYLLISILLLTACVKTDSAIKSDFEALKNRVEKRYVPDASLNLLEAELVKHKNRWAVKGETTVPEAAQTLLDSLPLILEGVELLDSMVVLPDPALGDSVYGITKVSVAHLRRDRGNAAEIIDQSILGDVLILLKEKRNWYLVKTHYGYLGWITGYSLQRIDEAGLQNYKQVKRLIVTKTRSEILNMPDKNSIPVCDLVLNNILKTTGKRGNWYQVELADGRGGYVHRADVALYNSDWKDKKATAEDIIKTAKSMMGVPYLWGGNSSKMNDCSGFTQNVFRANGIQLPRDARQQVHLGTEVKYDSTFSDVKPGDLLFFGWRGRITHVGISLGGYDFIHQDSFVNIDSFDKSAENFNARRLRSLKKIKRILN